MTINDYINQKFQSFGNLSEADLLDIMLNNGLNGADEVTLDNMEGVMVAIAKFIPSLLARPSSINESGFSISWDMDALKEFYAYLCRKYGLEDEINEISSIEDASEYW